MTRNLKRQPTERHCAEKQNTTHTHAQPLCIYVYRIYKLRGGNEKLMYASFMRDVRENFPSLCIQKVNKEQRGLSTFGVVFPPKRVKNLCLLSTCVSRMRVCVCVITALPACRQNYVLGRQYSSQ